MAGIQDVFPLQRAPACVSREYAQVQQQCVYRTQPSLWLQ